MTDHVDRSEAVFRVPVRDLGVDAMDLAFHSAEQSLGDGFSGVQFTDEDDILSRFVISMGEEFVDFAHVDAEHQGLYALPLPDAKRIIDDMRPA